MYCFFLGTADSSTIQFVAISGPPYNSVQNNSTKSTPLNKGNIAHVFMDESKKENNRLETRSLIKDDQDSSLGLVLPFDWSKSEFNESHEGLPDKWEFVPYTPNWSW